MFTQPVMEHYDYAMTLDTDGYFTENVPLDPIRRMHDEGRVYAWSHLLPDQAGAVRHFWNFSLLYFHLKGLLNTGASGTDFRNRPMIEPFIRPQDQEWSLNLYMNDIELVRLSFFRGEQYQSYFRYLDSLDGFFLYRWGDHALRTMAVGMFLQPEEVFQMPVPYAHQAYCQCLQDDGFTCIGEKSFYQLAAPSVDSVASRDSYVRETVDFVRGDRRKVGVDIQEWANFEREKYPDSYRGSWRMCVENELVSSGGGGGAAAGSGSGSTASEISSSSSVAAGEEEL